MDYTNIIGEKIKSLRTTKEISINDLSESTGLSVEQRKYGTERRTDQAHRRQYRHSVACPAHQNSKGAGCTARHIP